MNGSNTPAEILQIWIGNGVKKASLPVGKMFFLGCAAGCYIGLGAHAYLLATTYGQTPFESALLRLVGAALFPVGLMMVVLCGAELFTGNCLLTLAVMDKKISFPQALKNWIVVYLGNFAGSVLLAAALANSGLYPASDGVTPMTTALNVATAKATGLFLPLFIKGIFCNLLVVLACWLQAAAKELIGKLFAIWFPIMLFVFSGFEHSVANMFYIPLGMFLGADVSVGALLVGNLLPVTLGNLFGGAVVVPALYYYCYRPKSSGDAT